MRESTAAPPPRRALLPAQAAVNGPVRSPARGRAVGTFVPRLTQKAMQKYGFSTATVLTDWPAIVGPVVAARTLPERLKWPRRVDTYGDVEVADRGRPGAVLVLRVAPAFALEVQYAAAQIVDRINAYFGYRAIAELRLVQGALPSRAPTAQSDPRSVSTSPPPAASSLPASVAVAQLTEVASDRLRAALERLAGNVTAKR